MSQAIQINKPGAEIDKLEVEKESGITRSDVEFRLAKERLKSPKTVP